MESLKPTIPLVYQGVNVIVHMKIFVFSSSFFKNPYAAVLHYSFGVSY